MRMLPRLLALAGLAGLAGTALVATAAPAAASHLCDTPFCFVLDGSTIPVGTPAVPATGTGPASVPGPRLCDTTTGECTQTWVLLPGALVSANGTTLTTITIPAYGIDLDPSGTPTVYYGVPPVPPLDGSLEDSVTVVVSLPLVPVLTSGGEVLCPRRTIDDLETVQVRIADCRLVLTIRVL